MIITRTPMRVTLGGGGSDLTPNGRCFTAAINKYVYLAINDHYDDPPILLKYSTIERVKHVDDIQNRIIRDCMISTGTTGPIEISAMADLPAQSGLGGSGAFTVGLLHALHAHNGEHPYPHDLAIEASTIDTGWQDQYTATYGGCRTYDATTHSYSPVIPSPPKALTSNHFRLYDTGLRHDTQTVLSHTTFNPTELTRQYLEAVDAIYRHDIPQLGRCLTDQWDTKWALNPTNEHATIGDWIHLGITQGAYGGKLIGAGDGGCILFVTDTDLDIPLRRIPFTFEPEGTVRIV